MSNTNTTVLTLLHPDLLTVEQLRDSLQFRCCRIENLKSQTKEELVQLFRKFISPLPQRLYRTNRRGTMLTTRRMKSGLSKSETREAEKERISNSCGSTVSQAKISADRLKPPPDVTTSNKIRIISRGNPSNSGANSVDLDKIVINDRTKLSAENTEETGTPSSKRTSLKRVSEADKVRIESPTESKRQRVAIQWP